MCGIAGVIGLSDKSLIRKMCDIIAHRGPNHGGYHIDKDASIGYRRLAIIDVKGGNQPIYNEQGDICIVFNGEIYNYLDLKPALEKKGHKFTTNSDSETILHGYEEYGEGIVSKLRGMFAFAIWDSRKKKLLVARDRFGKKPVYFTHANGAFGFASEIKSLLLMPDFSKELDYSAIDSLLAFRFIPSPNTIFKNVKKLPASHFLIFEKGKLLLKRYWSLNYSPVERTDSLAAKKVRTLLEESVRIRLMSEVPLGAYLSGGLDSSAVVGYMSKLMDSEVKTFSVGFGVEKYDELKYAREVSEAFSTDHHEIIILPDSIKHLPQIIWHLDEPMADPTVIPTYLLSKFAKKKVTVVLTGEGGDEMFAGYEQYKFMDLAFRHGKKFPKFIRRHIIANAVRKAPKKLLDSLFKYSSALGTKGLDRFSDFISDLDSPARSYLELVQVYTQKERDALYGAHQDLPKGKNMPAAVDFSNKYSNSFSPSFAHGDLLSQMQLFDVQTQLVDDLLMKVDKMAMAASVEARAPLLDQELAALAFTLTPDQKIRGKVEKFMLRKATSQILPKSAKDRKKARFFVPLDYWFKDGLLDIASNLLIEGDRGLFDKTQIQKVIDSYSNSRAYAARQLWCLISLEMWMRTYLDNDGKAPLNYNELVG
ncbi:MAG: asparagine synthase (glutamine-hydrolyzing) [Candidatus Micrarchaeota archaeon]